MGTSKEADKLDTAVRAVARFLVADTPLGETLQQIAEVACDAIGKASVAGLTLLDDRGRPTTAVFTDALSPAVDQGQYDDGAGPCLDAYRQRTVVRVDDTREVAHRWGSFSQRAVEHGILSTLSLPLEAAGETLGALNLYSPVENGFHADEEEPAKAFATQASVVIANARSYWRAFDLSEGLRSAMVSRATIEQAKGIIMATKGCDPDEAFEILIRASQRENVKLRDIATRMVAARSVKADETA